MAESAKSSGSTGVSRDMPVGSAVPVSWAWLASPVAGVRALSFSYKDHLRSAALPPRAPWQPLAEMAWLSRKHGCRNGISPILSAEASRVAVFASRLNRMEVGRSAV